MSGQYIKAAVMIFGGIITLIPLSSAREVSMLGYRAVCPFSPISTLIMFGIGALMIYYARKGAAGSKQN